MDFRKLKEVVDQFQKSNMKPLSNTLWSQLTASQERIIEQDILTIRKQIIKQHFILSKNILIADKEHVILQNCFITNISIHGFYPIQLEDANGKTLLLFVEHQDMLLWFKLLKKECKQINMFQKYCILDRLFPNSLYNCQNKHVKIQNKKNHKDYLVQVHRLEDLYQSLEVWEQTQNEIQILRQLKHTGLLQVKEVFEDQAYLFVIFRYYQGESLIQLLNKGVQFNEVQMASVTYQVLSILQYLESHSIYHGGINPSNILINNSNQMLQITMINISFREPKVTDKIGWVLNRNYAEFIAPEVIDGEPPNIMSDIYSLGATLYFVTFFHMIYKISLDANIKQRCMIQQLEDFVVDMDCIVKYQQYLIDQQINKVEEYSISSSRIDLLEKLLTQHIVIKDLLKHQWFVNIKSQLRQQDIIRKMKLPVHSQLRTIIELRELSEQELKLSMLSMLQMDNKPDKIVPMSSKLDGTIFDDEEDEVVIYQKMSCLNHLIKHPSMKDV